MPYISTDDVKEIRNELKRALPNFKFSVTRSHYSAVNVSIMEGPIDLTEEPVKDELFNKVLSIVGKNNRIESEDADYGSIPNFYINIRAGKWDIPYVIKIK